ncbi:hypothetical protein D3C85_1465610 [compost metagenome]
MAQEKEGKDFLKLEGFRAQWDILGELDDHTVTGWDDRWVPVNSHFTKDAAEAFIKRKRHDYREGMRVYVDAQTHCWEYNTIKEAILQGRIGLTDELQRAKEDRGMLLAALEQIAGCDPYHQTSAGLIAREAIAKVNGKEAVNGNPD